MNRRQFLKNAGAAVPALALAGIPETDMDASGPYGIAVPSNSTPPITTATAPDLTAPQQQSLCKLLENGTLPLDPYFFESMQTPELRDRVLNYIRQGVEKFSRFRRRNEAFGMTNPDWMKFVTKKIVTDEHVDNKQVYPITDHSNTLYVSVDPFRRNDFDEVFNKTKVRASIMGEKLEDAEALSLFITTGALNSLNFRPGHNIIPHNPPISEDAIKDAFDILQSNVNDAEFGWEDCHLVGGYEVMSTVMEWWDNAPDISSRSHSTGWDSQHIHTRTAPVMGGTSWFLVTKPDSEWVAAEFYLLEGREVPTFEVDVELPMTESLDFLTVTASHKLGAEMINPQYVVGSGGTGV